MGSAFGQQAGEALATSRELGLPDNSFAQAGNETTIHPLFNSQMEPRKFPIRELLEQCLRTDDQACWKEFFTRIRKTIDGTIATRLRRWCRSYFDLIEDLRAETHLKLLNNEARLLRNLRYETEGQFLNYIAMTAGSVAEDYRRKRQKKDATTDSLDAIPTQDIPTQETAAAEAEAKEMWELVEKCLEKLRDEENFTRDCAIFRYFHRQRYSAREIGELPTIQLTTRAVETILSQLMRVVRPGMKKYCRRR